MNLINKIIEDEEYEEAYKLWVYYYYMTEAYDRTVCTAYSKHGNVLPANNYELGLINRNAIKERKKLNC